MGKLVRDLIPEIIRQNGGEPVTWQLPEEEILGALTSKLLEEAEEFRAAEPHEQLEEAADVYEVLRAMATTMGVSMEEIASRAQQKRADRGGFDQRIWLESW
ncbi:nucleoside triphosphate pyrophosphohydrolase [Kocuria sp. UCD-OTCP]|uniref:nucleoside triphosphate pyrophosphohydrolase n=1 Tax=Kocuria sp. UCD-OTCP TaxID=1292021 RepID=UPI00036FBED8|nr:nucleoside triphosphate pyrophosphohydrolase [Kocuria sp. UCD-OTCP]EYT53302.1 phosphoribosyl-ATP pyrophosphohydrolase [Kocuria sp. UCD-OTCP]